MKYYSKSDAIKSINKSNTDHLRLIQKDKDDTGKKYFYTMSIDKLYTSIKNNMSNEKDSHYYESWTERTPLVFSLDIDAELPHENKNFDDIIKTYIQEVKRFSKKFYGYEYETENIIVLKTNKQSNKNSAHVIFRGLMFESHLVCKNFYDRISKEKKLKYADGSIYNLTCLRTCFSTKKGKNYPLKPYVLNINGIDTASVDDYSTELDFFSQSLITTIDELEEKNKTITINDIVEVEEQDIVFKFTKNEHTDGQILELLSHLPQEYCDDYAKWNKVGMTLFSLSEDYENLFDEWSKKSNKYKPGGVKSQWNWYKKSKNFDKSLLNIGSLIYWAKEGGYEFPDKNIEHIISSYKEKKIVITNTNEFNLKTVSLKKLNTSIFLPHLNTKLLALQSEKGTGKTYNLLRSLFDENKETPPDSILFISSRRTFGIKLSADLKKYGFRLYSEIEEQYIYDKRVICQIDSLYRLQRDKFDLVIIDECESVARYLTSTHFTKSSKANQIISDLEFKIADANNVIIMDADLSDRCVRYYTSVIKNSKDIRKNDIQLIINSFTPYQEYKIKYSKYNTWLNHLIKFVMDNKKLVVPMASNSKAKDLYSKLKTDFPDKNILLIHKETSDDDKLQKLLKVNEIWVNYDIVIYTPTVCMGVSFEPEHFDNIFAYGCHNSLGAQEFCQMLHRVRNPKDKNIFVSFDHYKYFDCIEDSINYEQVEEMLTNDYYLTYHDLNSNVVQKKYKRVGKERVMFYPYKEEPVYDLYVRNCIESIENKLNFTASFFGYTKYKKYQYEFFQCDDTEDYIKELKEIRKEREQKEKEELVENIFNAETLSKEQYKEKIMRKDRYLDDKSLYEIKRFNLMKNYNLDEEDVTEEIIDQYYDRKKMLNYNNLSSIKSSTNQGYEKKLEIMKSNEIINPSFNTCFQDFTYKNKYTYHFYAIRLLEYVGLSIDSIDNMEIYIEKHDLEINMYKHIEGKDIFKFLKDEKFGIYQKFDIRMLLNREIEEDVFYALKIVNKVIQSQYGIKVKKKGKKNPVYFLSTNDMWSNLPHESIMAKDLLEYKAKEKDNENVLSNLDNDLFQDSSDEEDNNLVEDSDNDDFDKELDNYNENILIKK